VISYKYPPLISPRETENLKNRKEGSAPWIKGK
jgi:hypothetical protein